MIQFSYRLWNQKAKETKQQTLWTDNISSIHVYQFVQALSGGLGEQDFSFG